MNGMAELTCLQAGRAERLPTLLRGGGDAPGRLTMTTFGKKDNDLVSLARLPESRGLGAQRQ